VRQTERVLDALKRQLRARGMTYARLAAALGVSLPTVKRMFSGRDVTLSRLEAACEAAGIELADLVAATRTDSRPDRLTPAQETALAAEPRLLSLFNYLLNQWSVETILRELAIDEPECVRLLAHLDRLKLIELHPGNRVRLRVAHAIVWDPNGAVRRRHAARAAQEFMLHAFDQPGEAAHFAVREVSRASHELMLRKLARLAAECNELADLDAALDPGERAAIGFVLAVRPFKFSVFDAIARRGAPPEANPRRARGRGA
jgi:transcriptional regulator with XRE-family HTH domain